MASVTLPLASVRPWISLPSQRPLLLASTQTSALRIRPSMTVVVTAVVVAVLSMPPPPHALRAAAATRQSEK